MINFYFDRDIFETLVEEVERVISCCEQCEQRPKLCKNLCSSCYQKYRRKLKKVTKETDLSLTHSNGESFPTREHKKEWNELHERGQTQRWTSEVAPFLIKEFGDLETFFRYILHLKCFQPILSPIMREKKRVVVKKDVERFQEVVNENAPNAMFSSLSSMRQWDRQRSMLYFIHPEPFPREEQEQQPQQRSRRISLPYGVKGVKFPSSETLKKDLYEKEGPFLKEIQRKLFTEDQEWRTQGR